MLVARAGQSWNWELGSTYNFWEFDTWIDKLFLKAQTIGNSLGRIPYKPECLKAPVEMRVMAFKLWTWIPPRRGVFFPLTLKMPQGCIVADGWSNDVFKLKGTFQESCHHDCWTHKNVLWHGSCAILVSDHEKQTHWPLLKFQLYIDFSFSFSPYKLYMWLGLRWIFSKHESI